MMTRWNQGWSDFDDMFTAMNELRDYMDRVLEEGPTARTWDRPMFSAFTGTWPRMNLLDGGSTLVVNAEVPGLSEKDVTLSLNQEVITIAGERKAENLEGYSTHRQERPAVQFTRSFALPCRVNPERAMASVKNGILSVTMEKATEALPRQITVKAS